MPQLIFRVLFNFLFFLFHCRLVVDPVLTYINILDNFVLTIFLDDLSYLLHRRLFLLAIVELLLDVLLLSFPLLILDLDTHIVTHD